LTYNPINRFFDMDCMLDMHAKLDPFPKKQYHVWSGNRPTYEGVMKTWNA